VLVLRRLDDAALELLIARAEAHYGNKLPLTAEARASLRAMADGDGRYLLNLVEEVAALNVVQPLDSASLVAAVQKRAPLYDKSREEHYNLISALHKSIRGSDPDAALYWLARMLAGGEDPLYIARRLVRASVEDIGLADPQAVAQALAAKDVYDFLGSPEGEIALAQCVLYLATAPKSNAVYVAQGAARRAAADYGSLVPPAHILNAPTRVTVPSSITGRNESCWLRLKRWISSIKSSVPCPMRRRMRAASNAFFRSATPENTADNCSKCRLKAVESSRAMVVLPVPGGPHRTIEEARPCATMRPMGPSGARR
jgi:hypothetical protein